MSDVLTADGLKRKCGDELITRAYNDPELAGRSAIDRDTDLPTEIVLVDLTGSPVRVRSRLPVGNGFADELSERVFRNPLKELSRTLGRTIRPMPFLDVPERPFCYDNLPRCFVCEAGPDLCLYHAIAEDYDHDHGNPHT